MCKCHNLFLPLLTILVGLLLLASNYGYVDGYHVQAWWPILLVIVGAFKLVKQFCCSKNSCDSTKGSLK